MRKVYTEMCMYRVQSVKTKKHNNSCESFHSRFNSVFYTQHVQIIYQKFRKISDIIILKWEVRGKTTIGRNRILLKEKYIDDKKKLQKQLIDWNFFFLIVYIFNSSVIFIYARSIYKKKKNPSGIQLEIILLREFLKENIFFH